MRVKRYSLGCLLCGLLATANGGPDAKDPQAASLSSPKQAHQTQHFFKDSTYQKLAHPTSGVSQLVIAGGGQ
jgi:hypothetical protein